MTADAPRDDDHELETASLCPKTTWDSCEPQRARAEMNLDDPANANASPSHTKLPHALAE